jgi:molecular chaperone HscB
MTGYFELYGLPQSFHPDPAKVKSKYYELSRLYHPDRFAQAGDTERAEALRMAALNNDAYKTLGSEDATMAYILKQHELLKDEEKYSLPPDFLMEMMELNEAISEYEMDGDATAKENAAKMLNNLLEDWKEQAGELTDAFDAGRQDKELLLQVKDYYFRKKYLLRIQHRIEGFK